MPDPDTVFFVTNIGLDGFYCLDLSQLYGPATSITNFCPSTGGPVVFALTSDDCIEWVPVSIGTATACIQICDDYGICDTTYIIVDVISTTVATPNLGNDNTATVINLPVVIEVLNNDTLNGPLLSIDIMLQPANGTAIILPNNTIQYTPNTDYCGGTDSLWYVVYNGVAYDTATVYFEVICDSLVIYNGFSPNGDNKNETFVILGIENFPDAQVIIFNRWGNQVYNARPYLNDWNGTWQGATLPDGTYFYIIEFADGRSRTGYIQIQR